MNELDEIVSNARNGVGPCAGCPAQADTQGEFVNPGLLNYNADLMFLTMDPSHFIDWTQYDDWSAYNADKGHEFKTNWPGGNAISKILDGIRGITLDNIWLADAIKCPVNNDRAGNVNSDEAFAHCSTYLKREIKMIDPQVIVTMGNDPAEQLLNRIFEVGVESIHAGTGDCGQIYDTRPPVVISPHWANGWLGRHNNRAKVRNAILKVLKKDEYHE